MNVLCVSPVPSHPQDQGNAMGIAALGRLLKQEGCRVHFVYAALEGLSTAQAEQMVAFWDGCHFVAIREHERRQRDPAHWCLDDFYVRAVDSVIDHLIGTHEFDVCLVHYVWFSAAFERLPAGVRRVLYTHDRFGNRHHDDLARGSLPNWFYTSVAEEARGLSRADLVLAVQEDEAEYFQSISETPVLVAGAVFPRRFLPARHSGRRLRAGYLASGNPTNIRSLESLARSINSVPDVLETVDFVVGGKLCEVDVPGTEIINRIGHVDDAADFYAALDVSLNPTIGGTGLKIKTIEALSYGLPVVSTIEGMLGVATSAREHQCADTDDLIQMLLGLAGDPDRLSVLRAASRHAFLAYRARQLEAYRSAFAGPIRRTIADVGPHTLLPDAGHGHTGNDDLTAKQGKNRLHDE